MARPLKCAMRGRRQVWPPNSMPEGPRASGGRNPPPCRPRGGSGLTKTECVLTPLSCRRRYLLLYCAAGPLIFCRSWIIRRPRGRTQPRVLARIGDGARWSWKDLIALSELEITPLQPRTVFSLENRGGQVLNLAGGQVFKPGSATVVRF